MSVNSAVKLGSRAEGHTSWSVVKTSSSKKSTAKVAGIRSSTLSVVRPTMNQRRVEEMDKEDGRISEDLQWK